MKCPCKKSCERRSATCRLDCFFGLRKWNKRFGELYDELKREVE